MANNFSGLNVSTGAGEGAAVVPQFSRTDRAINLLYQQQQQRQQAGYNDYLNNQRELDKELANARSADIPELRNLYDTQKQLHQQLLFNNKLQNNRQAYNQVEKAYQEANMKLLQGIHGSIETQNFDKTMNEDMIRNPDSYNDDARTTLSKAMQLPNSERTQLGYNSVEPYLYGGGNYDWQKSIKDAQGTPQTIFGQQALTKDGLTYQTPTFSALANPARFQQSLLGDLAQRKAGKSAAFEYAQLNPQQIDAVNKAYDAIPQSEFDKWGIQKPNLDIPNKENGAGQYVSYLSKLYALNNLPTAGKVEMQRNDAGYLAAENKYATQRLAIAQQYKKAFHDYIGAKNNSEQGSVLNNLVQQQVDNSPTQRKINVGGTEYTTKQISIPTQISAEYTKDLNHADSEHPDNLAQPKGWYITTDGKFLIPLYPTTKKTKSGAEIHDTKKSEMIPVSNYLADLGRWYLSKKQAGEELGDDDFGIADGQNAAPISNSGSVSKRPPLNSFIKK